MTPQNKRPLRHVPPTLTRQIVEEVVGSIAVLSGLALLMWLGLSM